mmetsp:Transcript_3262/g.11282  ORF Transcript_3262/g.11282 Transcript_3262/m.11282 type:complete len:200 (-) Transcript_3262:711-1310(-)
MVSAICHTWRMLSSATVATTQFSLGFHEKSEILLVCPPCTKSSSGGPSSASSGDCSSPMRDRSHTCARRSEELEPRMVSLKGAHCTWNTPSVWPSNVCSFCLRLRESHSATVQSEEPVTRRNSLKGLNATQFTSTLCVSDTTWEGPSSRESQMMRRLSSPTEPKRWGWWRCQSTSSTTDSCPRHTRVGTTSSGGEPAMS